eukprot:TRINITY_DN26600_c0_g1_i1.p1 TRINITY_DN26600_c0_g1~~TRINITY_DN26600_c0_g1_i1.p1  ORF type:complete len:935 (+),score=194.86 TRINITY_DN26600_c0_g1_i1:172-2976(+)
MEEMDSVEAYNNQCMEDTSAHQLLSPDSPEIGGIYGDPEVTPRLGDQYQVEIPPLMMQSDCLETSANHAKGIVDADCSVIIGLPIPVMWVHDLVHLTRHKQLDFLGDTIHTNTTEFVLSKDNNELNMNSRRSKVGQFVADISGHNATVPEDSAPKLGILDVASDDGKGLRSSEVQENKMLGNQMNVDSFSPQYDESNLVQNHESNNYYPVPGSSGGSWSEMEQESFLLGLYIFGKNFVQVKRFIGSKGMGDILSFYYGKFYRSEGNRRWSECRKMRSRRCIYGQRIFTGWRQQELLARLLPHTSENCANTLLEVTKSFSEGKVSLEEYVSILKGAVGLKVLVEATAIGKGKHNLTGIAMEPMKTNQVISTRSEIPVGKACSSLSSAEIIKFLTGDFRLSKARSNDLFWEAVWPRLLARGWHSEQPKDCAYVGSRHSLVFLVPGIKKFSRRKLVKGNHYFDSVTDVLNKVASDPKLLELEVEAVNGSGVKEEYELDMDAKLNKTGPSEHQRPLYLRPRVPNCNSELMKFTIVDTSLAHGELYKIRELRSLPMDCAHTSSHTSPSSELDSSSSGERVTKPEQIDDALLDGQEESCATITDNAKLGNNMNGMLNAGVRSDLCSYLRTLSKQCMPMDVSDNHEDKESMKCRFSRTKSGRPGYLSPILKRRRLTACSRAESNHRANNSSVGPPLKEEPVCQKSSLGVIDNIVAEGGPSQQKAATSSSGKCSLGESSECFPSENCFISSTSFVMAFSHEEPEPRAIIDLNLPHVSPDFGMGEPFNAEPSDCRVDSDTKGASFPLATNQRPEDSSAMRTSNDMDAAQTPVANARRQSTRNRPLTTRVLESLECGFFSTRRRGRGTAKALSRRNTIPRSSRRRVRGHCGVSETTTTNSGNVCTDSMDSKVEGVDEYSSHMTSLDKPQSPSERKEKPDLHGVP